MRRTLLFSCVMALCCSTSAMADTQARQCISAAQSEGLACRKECTREQQNDVLECRTGSKGDCGAACGATFSECRSPIQDQRDAGRESCIAIFEASKLDCATAAGCTINVNCGGSSEYFQCVTDARVAEASCKVQVMRDSSLNTQLRVCSRALTRCLRQCR